MQVAPLNALTIDVEEHYHAHAIAAHATAGASRESRVVQNTAAILDTLAAAQVTATFFVLGEVAEQQPRLVRRIYAAGHEIACHGHSHALIYRQDPPEFRAETLRAKQTLEDITGEPVFGYRASTFSIRRDSRWALAIIAEAGFTYDSSIAPVRHDLYGIPASPAKPYRIAIDACTALLEIPVATIPMLGIRLIVGGGGYFRQFPYRFTRWALRSIEAADDGPFVFYLHPWEFDPDQPRATGLPWLARVRHYTNLSKTDSRFRALLSDFRFGPVRDMLTTIGSRCSQLGIEQLGMDLAHAS